ncbi:hypothetical protein HELRODRAFT_167323 [Helobdella robusta]|uniref:SUEL-type lectin domain-containing protein n=1 Tax=Helobdella robusta TaxID=6412 RepID=T1EZ94_HELRO|nr:hypothetical protein HELRODRAFT_167323 [Helobdella robusta]ESO10823.1 hypothetical protein HELRODRAFT_167323 [Helobdella robusta]
MKMILLVACLLPLFLSRNYAQEQSVNYYETIPSCLTIAEKSSLDQLVPRQSAILYTFSDKKNCTKEANFHQSLIRCTGQTFPPSSQWCPPGTTIKLVAQFYKHHPFCCPGTFDPLTPPLDISSATTLSVNYQSPDYLKEIEDCLKVDNCSVMSKNATSDLVGFGYCPNENTTFDSLAIIYQCLG